MATYAIGDLQGCHAQLCALLDHIGSTESDFDTADLLFVGDIVNRGPASLETLRHLHRLDARAKIVLGNHDLHLLAAAHGIREPHHSDTLQAILQAPDRDLLLDWLRRQPLARLEADCLIVHAGVLPQWSAAQTLALSAEVEAALQGPNWIEFLSQMYGNTPTRWEESLTGAARLRCIVNALTRMRTCLPNGDMIFDEQQDRLQRPTAALPWFDAPNRCTTDITVVFGHWSALGLQLLPNLIGLDTGCLWGGKLTAVRLEDRAVFQINCPAHRSPGSAMKSPSDVSTK